MKTKKTNTLVLCLLAGWSLPARAETGKPYCTPLAELTKQMNHCVYNGLLSRAAESCVKKFENELAIKTAALNLGLAANAASGTDAQRADFTRQSAGLGMADQSLESLRNSAEKVRAELADYADNFLRAGNITPAQAKNMNKYYLKMLDTYPCYKENRKLVMRGIQFAIAKSQELGRGSKAMESMIAHTDDKGARLDNAAMNAGKLVATTHAIGAAVAAPGGNRSPAANGTITGIETDAAKRAIGKSSLEKKAP